jgi:molybdopterin-binding protein
MGRADLTVVMTGKDIAGSTSAPFKTIQTLCMTLSARNQLAGTVEEIQLGGVMAHIGVRVGDNLIESVITRRSAEAMALKKGDSVKVVIKSTEVMLQKD